MRCTDIEDYARSSEGFQPQHLGSVDQVDMERARKEAKARRKVSPFARIPLGRENIDALMLAPTGKIEDLVEPLAEGILVEACRNKTWLAGSDPITWNRIDEPVGLPAEITIFEVAIRSIQRLGFASHILRQPTADGTRDLRWHVIVRL